MHWCHSLTLRLTNEDSHLHNWVFAVFSTYCGKFSYLSHYLLHLIKYHWSFSYHWHNFLMSTIKVKTQTRFMVLFTSGSSLTWGNLQVLHLASPPGIHLLSTINNQLLTSLQRLHDDWICIFCQKGREVGEGYDVFIGESQHLPQLPGTPVSFLWGTTFHQQPKNLGGHPGTLQQHGLSPGFAPETLWRLRIMAYPWFG